MTWRRVIVCFTAVLAAACSPRERAARVTLATTTSVENSGLLGSLLPAFGTVSDAHVIVTTPGSGRALEMLRRAEADVAISHAPRREAALLREVRDWLYRKLMFNDFVLVGPPGDPAGVRKTTSVEEAMRAIARSPARFISRGDSSGTHERELQLWKLAGVSPDPDRIVVAGSGMGATLRVAGNVEAYTLSDRATFAHHAMRGDLQIVLEGGPQLVNTYAVVVRAGAPPTALTLADWLTDGAGRDLIDRYHTASGVRAFTAWPPDCPRDSAMALPCER